MRKYLSPLILLMLLASAGYATEPIWLSTSPPRSLKDDFDSYGMRRFSVKKIKRGKVVVYLWIKSGMLPGNSTFLKHFPGPDPDLFVFGPEGKPLNGEIKPYRNFLTVNFPGAQEGYYNIYLVNRYMSGDTLNIAVTKKELLSHYCRNGHDKALLKVKPKIYSKSIPLEVIRERFSLENFHTVILPGDEVTYRFLINDSVAAGGTARLITQNGWMKEKRVGPDGKVTFKFIQDDLSEWNEISRRKRHTYILTFDQTSRKAGEYEGVPYSYVHYSAVFSDLYRPGHSMYSSMLWALAVFVLFIIFTSVGVYLYRRRNRIEFKEVSLDE